MTPAELVKSLEGCRLAAYPDPATGGKPWTIGFGHTGPSLWGSVGPDTVWTHEKCEAQLVHDLEAFARVTDPLIHVPITPTEHAALLSFAYNEGSHRLMEPTCRILPLLNAGDHLSAAGQFMHWTMANGKRMLVSRRMKEIEVFLSELGVL